MGGRLENYKLRVPANVPAKEFCSTTVYDNLTRSMTMNKADDATISSYDKITLSADGSADLHFGPKAPAGLESNWVDTSTSKDGSSGSASIARRSPSST